MSPSSRAIDQIPSAKEMAGYLQVNEQMPLMIMVLVGRERLLNAVYAFLGMGIAVGVLIALLWFAYIAAFIKGSSTLTAIFVGGTCLNVVLKFLAARLQK